MLPISTKLNVLLQLSKLLCHDVSVENLNEISIILYLKEFFKDAAFIFRLELLNDKLHPRIYVTSIFKEFE